MQWNNMLRNFGISKKSIWEVTSFFSFYLFLARLSTSTEGDGGGEGLGGRRGLKRADGIQMSRWQVTTPRAEVRTGTGVKIWPQDNPRGFTSHLLTQSEDHFLLKANLSRQPPQPTPHNHHANDSNRMTKCFVFFTSLIFTLAPRASAGFHTGPPFFLWPFRVEKKYHLKKEKKNQMVSRAWLCHPFASNT